MRGQTFLIMADPHLENTPLTEYRWRIFPWIKETVKKYKIDEIAILGDLTEKKDKHDAKLVNRIIENIVSISFSNRIHILCGNHDYIGQPFFSFFNAITKNIYFYDESDVYINKFLFIPHYSSNEEFINSLFFFKKVEYIFCHQELEGIQLPNKHTLTDGVKRERIKEIKVPIFSGHIHQPMKIGNLEYIGSPYQIYFEEYNNYKGRAIILDTDSGKIKYLEPDVGIGRYKIELNNIAEIKAYELKKDDQVKIKVKLSQNNLHLWDSIRKDIINHCKDNEILLVSLEAVKESTPLQSSIKVERLNPQDIIKKYAIKENLDSDFIESAIRIIDENN